MQLLHLKITIFNLVAICTLIIIYSSIKSLGNYIAVLSSLDSFSSLIPKKSKLKNAITKIKIMF